MIRLHDRLLLLEDRIQGLAEEERLALEELRIHEHLCDDAIRDSAVSESPIDREDARETAADVARFERVVSDLRRRRLKLEQKRDRLAQRLG
jgi:hypothetical protein